VRLFVAVELPDLLRERLAALITRLSREITGPKWARAEGIHLTLRFLGEVGEPDLPRLRTALSAIADNPAHGFEVSVRGLGLFPDKGRPRVLWIGLHEPGDALKILQARVEASVREAGLPGIKREDRSFRPHLTLARFGDAKPSIPIREYVERRKNEDLGILEVSSVTLFQSVLHPSGAQYKAIQEYRL